MKTGHYLNQCSPRCPRLYCITRPQWDKKLSVFFLVINSKPIISSHKNYSFLIILVKCSSMSANGLLLWHQVINSPNAISHPAEPPWISNHQWYTYQSLYGIYFFLCLWLELKCSEVTTRVSPLFLSKSNGIISFMSSYNIWPYTYVGYGAK